MGKRPFYLTKRKLKSGNRVYYYYYYNQLGIRTVPKTTGCSKKADAFQYCVNLLKANNLENNKLRFKTYAYNFFETSHTWYKNNSMSKSVKESTIKGYRNYFNNHVYPYFSEMFIDKITSTIVKEFRVHLASDCELANKTINNIVAVLSIIMKQAEEENVILRNPCRYVKKLSTDSKRDAFTSDEVDTLLTTSWNNSDAWLVCLTSAITGMRFSEVLGLQPYQLKDGYIDVCQQFYDGEICSVKTDENRFVTVPKELEDMLRKNVKGNFVFTSESDIDKPISRTTVTRHMFKHYTKDMIETKDDRLLTFHSFRHFLNTYLISNNTNSHKINFMIGHSEGKGTMLSLYTSWKPEMYKDIYELQTELLDKIMRQKHQSQAS